LIQAASPFWVTRRPRVALSLQRMAFQPNTSFLALAAVATRRALGVALPPLLALAALGPAQAGVVAPPLSAALLVACRGGPCLATLPRAEPAAAAPAVQTRSSKRVTRRST
jgi:hypothetical protein